MAIDDLKELRGKIIGRKDSRYDNQMIELLDILIEEAARTTEQRAVGNHQAIHDAVIHGLRHYFSDHGDMAPKDIGSAAKRIMGKVRVALQSSRATPEPSGEVVERVARAIYANNPATRNGAPMSWDEAMISFPERQYELISDAKAAIAAYEQTNASKESEK